MIQGADVNPVEPVERARQALGALPLAERRRLLQLQRQGLDGNLVVQNHLEEEQANYAQAIAEFSERIFENMRRVEQVNQSFANALESVNYLEAIEKHISVITQTLSRLEEAEEGIAELVDNFRLELSQLEMKKAVLLETLIALHRQLGVLQQQQTRTGSIIDGVGQGIIRYSAGIRNKK